MFCYRHPSSTQWSKMEINSKVLTLTLLSSQVRTFDALDEESVGWLNIFLSIMYGSSDKRMVIILEKAKRT